MERRRYLGSLGAGTLAALGGCISVGGLGPQVSRSEGTSFGVDGVSTLAVANGNGSVTVTGHEGDAVDVDVEKTGPSEAAVEAASVEGRRSDGELLIETVHDATDENGQATVALTVRCPSGVAVRSVTTTNGSVELTDVAGDATVETENGSITAEAVDGTVTLSTTNGSITARDIGGLAGATTSNGSVGVDVPAIPGDPEIRTSNASVDAALALDLDATVTATTDNGSVDVSGVEFSSPETTDERVSGTLGDGTHEVTITTRNGSISLTALSSG